MVQTITFQDFVDAFRARGRQDQFSYEALRLIFDWYEDTDPDYELDVVGICCEWVEEDSSTVRDQYNAPDLGSGVEDDEQHDAIVEYLEDSTIYLGNTSIGYVFRSF